MAINWNSIIEGASAGIAASILLSIFLILRNFGREVVFRFRLTRDIRRLSCGSGITGVTIGIANEVGRLFTVRSVLLVTDKVNFGLNPTGDVSTQFKGMHPKITRKQKRLLKQGKITTIPLGSQIQHRPWRVEPEESGFTVVDPFTSHQFLLPAELLSGIEGEVSEVQVTLEYTNWTGAARMMKISAKKNSDHIQQTIEHIKEQIESGQFDIARSRFRMPPVKRPPQQGEKQTKPNKTLHTNP